MIEPVRARSDHAMLEAIDHSSALHRWPSHSSAALSEMLSIDLQAGLHCSRPQATTHQQLELEITNK